MRTDGEQEFASAVESQSEYMDSLSETASGAVSENDMVAEVVSMVFSSHLLKSDPLLRLVGHYFDHSRGSHERNHISRQLCYGN
jgi:hypothetical protein